jgi:hypothetical protein
MANKFFLLIALCAVALSGTGCDKIGQTPAGGSDADVKAKFDSMPLEERAKAIMGSPMPATQKAQKIKEIYAKAGKPVPENLPSGGATGPAPGAATGN